ncbi:MAG: hypothetical protein V1873_08945 [Verrucomicrobiota bacterium]
MADIVVKCSKCGKESRVSEYAGSGSVPCPACKAPLQMPAAEKGSLRLHMRKGKHDVPADLNADGIKRKKIPKGAEPPTADQVQAVLSNVHKSRQRVQKPHGILAVLSFLLVGGVLVGFQYYAKIHPQLMQYYLWTRGGLVGLVWLLVVLFAFQDSTFQGLLVVFAPLYIVYYVFVRLDSYLLQGAASAAFVALGTELYFIPPHSVMVHAQAGLNHFIEAVAGLVVRAGEPPGMPH